MGVRSHGSEPAPAIETGHRFRDRALDTVLRVTYVTEDAVVASTDTGMYAFPRDLVERDLDRGALAPD